MRTVLGTIAVAVAATGVPAVLATASAAGPPQDAATRLRPARSASPSAASGPGAAASSATRFALPVDGPARVVAAFDPPRTRYGPGHLGVDLAVAPNGAVRAAADGTVRFAGHVAGRGVVVLEHAGGITTEYEPLAARVSAGVRVRRGATLGSVSGRHGACRADSCLHWGARRGGAYVDPMALLAGLGPVRLLPWVG